MHPNVKTVNAPLLRPPTADGLALDVNRITGRKKNSPLSKMNEIVANHPSESLNVIRNWLHQGH